MTTASPFPSVSIIVPAYNGGENLERCLVSLVALAPAAHELVVVDDGSTDDSARLAAGFGAKVLHTGERGGPAAARNLGAQEATGDVLLFLDADVTVEPDLIGRVAETFAREPELTALFGSYDDAPAATNFLSQYKNLLHHYVHQTAHEDAFTFWTGCGAVRREVFLRLGGFDESYREPAIEDIELGYRLRRAGHRIRLVKDLQVKHLKRWRARDLLRSDFAQRALPWSVLILHHRQFANDLNIGWSSRLSVLAVGVLVASLGGACFCAPILALAGASALMLLLLNWPLYRFFSRKRALFFVLRAIPWHWLYFLYSGLAFAVALLRHLYRGMTGRLSAQNQSDGNPDCTETVGQRVP